MLVVNKLGEKNAREINEELTRAVLGCYCSDLIDDGILRRGKGGVIAWLGFWHCVWKVKLLDTKVANCFTMINFAEL